MKDVLVPDPVRIKQYADYARFDRRVRRRCFLGSPTPPRARPTHRSKLVRQFVAFGDCQGRCVCRSNANWLAGADDEA